MSDSERIRGILKTRKGGEYTYEYFPYYLEDIKVNVYSFDIWMQRTAFIQDELIEKLNLALLRDEKFISLDEDIINKLTRDVECRCSFNKGLCESSRAKA